MTPFPLLKAVVLLGFVWTISAVKWPRGTYTLVKPDTGCPRGWFEGWRYQDAENSVGRNNIDRYPHNFYGIYGTNPRDFTFSYCTKDVHDFNDEGNWPAGNYCIFRQGRSCPPGFNSGIVFWDDENTNNQNRHGGTLPSGQYFQDTNIFFCCRSDGYWMNQIKLPNTQPFFLLMYTAPHCQVVEGMFTNELGVTFNDESTNNQDAAYGPHPLRYHVNGHQTLIGYCYYSPY